LKKIFQTLIIVLIIAQPLYSSGFQINEHGARGMAMAGAFTAIVLDPSAIYYNPAGISQLPGTRFMLGTTIISPSSTFRGVAPEITENELEARTFTPINFYITHQINNEWYVGLGINNQYGLGTTWDENWIGKYLAIDTEVKTFFVPLVVTYKISEEFSIGVGATFVFGDVEIIRKNSLSPFEGDANVDLSGDGTGWGFSGGLLYKPSETISLGLSYRSQVSLTFDGTANTTGPSQFDGLLPSGSITAPLTLPDNITLGIGVFPSKVLKISADFQYVGWSSYDKLEVTFNDVPDENGDPLVNTAIRDYENSWIARVGAEYTITDSWDLRGGVLYDKNPVKDEWVEPSLPDSDRWGFNLGFGYKITPNLILDVAYMYLRFEERTIENSNVDYTPGIAPFNGTYNSSAHLLGLNFSYYIN